MDFLWQELPGGKIILDKRAFEELLRRIRQIPSHQKQRFEELLLNIPDYQEALPNREWSRKDYHEFFQNKEEILRAIKKL